MTSDARQATLAYTVTRPLPASDRGASLPAGEGARLCGRQLSVGGRSVVLTGSESSLLACLVEAGPRVVSRVELTRALWGSSIPDPGRAIDTHIHRLRRKLAVLPGVEIATIRSRGFRLELAGCASGLLAAETSQPLPGRRP